MQHDTDDLANDPAGKNGWLCVTADVPVWYHHTEFRKDGW